MLETFIFHIGLSLFHQPFPNPTQPTTQSFNWVLLRDQNLTLKTFASLKYRQPEKQDDFSTLKKDTRPGSLRANLKVIILHSPGTCPEQSRRGFGISYLANELHSPCSQPENCLPLSAREHIISLPVNILCH